MKTKKGLTLIELMITVVIFAILTGVMFSIFRAVLLSWSSQEERTGIDISVDIGIEKIARELREAIDVQSTDDYHEMRFTVEENGLDADYIFYLYNEDDSYVPPPAFDQETYELKKATLSGGIGGTFNYGDGQLIVTDVVSPNLEEDPKTELSIDADNIITIILKLKRGNEIITSKTQVKPRGL